MRSPVAFVFETVDAAFQPVIRDIEVAILQAEIDAFAHWKTQARQQLPGELELRLALKDRIARCFFVCCMNVMLDLGDTSAAAREKLGTVIRTEVDQAIGHEA